MRNNLTLYNIINFLYSVRPQNEYSIEYRVLDNEKDICAGFATVHKKMSGWSLEPDDLNGYLLSDEVLSYAFNEDGSITAWVQ